MTGNVGLKPIIIEQYASGGDHKTSNNGFLLSEEVQRQIPTVYDFRGHIMTWAFFLLYSSSLLLAMEKSADRREKSLPGG